MNQQQRKFLIDKLKEEYNRQKKELESQFMKLPNPDNYMYLAIMSGTARVRDHEEILATVKNYALKSEPGASWLTESHRWGRGNGTIIDVWEIFEQPEEFRKAMQVAKAHNEALEEKILELKILSDTMETRIQLASGKTLEGIIQDVDDLGDLRLVDQKLKLLN